jgi:hypothetical protein
MMGLSNVGNGFKKLNPSIDLVTESNSCKTQKLICQTTACKLGDGVERA